LTTIWPAESHSRQRIRVGLLVFRLRESSGGVLGGDYGLRLPAERRVSVALSVRRNAPGSPVEVRAAVTPPCERAWALRMLPGIPEDLAAQVEAITAQAVKARLEFDAAAALASDPLRADWTLPTNLFLELHFPVQDRLATLEETVSAPQVDAAGRIFLGDPASVQCEGFWAGLASRRRGADGAPDFVFSHKVTLPAADAALHLSPFLTSQGWSGPLPELDGEGPREVTCVARLAGPAADGWLSLPDGGPHSMAFHRRLKPGIFAMQRALRLWTSYDFFADAANYLQRTRAWPVLVYGAMRPTEGRRMYDYTADTLDPQRLSRSLRCASGALRIYAKSGQQRLLRTGEHHRKVAQVLPIRSRDRIVKAMSACPVPRGLSMLVNGEAHITEAIAAQGRRVARCSDATRYLRREGIRLYRLISIQMGHLNPSHSFRHLTPLLYLASTWGLAWAAGLCPRLELLVGVRDPATGSEKWTGSTISYENPRRRKPLPWRHETSFVEPASGGRGHGGRHSGLEGGEQDEGRDVSPLSE